MKHFLVIGLFLFFSYQLFPMDWPSLTGTVTRNFGWNYEGQPHLGVSFATEGNLTSAEDGELLYRRSYGDSASRLPSPLGSWVALDHGDGIISIYSRFDDRTSPMIPEKIEKGTILGEAGISGWSSQRGFYFQIFDRKERRWINPFRITSSPPVDIRAPEILSVRLRDTEGRLFNPLQTRNLNQGRYTVIVHTIDTLRSPAENPLAPYRIICSLNGSEAGVLNFETYSARNGSLMVYRNGLVPVRQVYAPFPAYEVAELRFTRGQTNLEIISQDMAGNVRTVFYRLQIE
jgi:hypothetical protein